MSQLTDFNTAGYTIAKDIIGTTDFAIGTGDNVVVVAAESRHNRESEMNGFQSSASLTVVCSVSDFTATYAAATKTYLGKNCTHDGDPWRIGGIEDGAGYVTITLVSRTEVS